MTVTNLLQYRMRANLTYPPYQVVTWYSPNVPDYVGTLSGYSPSLLTNITIDGQPTNLASPVQYNEPSGPASGDLAGMYPDPTVVGVNGIPINTSVAPTNGEVLTYNSSDGKVEWQSATGGISQLTGDVLAGPGIGTLASKVVSLSGNSGVTQVLSTLEPTDITYNLGTITNRFNTLCLRFGITAATSLTGAGSNMIIQAESAKAGSNASGGNLILSGGIHDGAANDGVIQFNVGGTQQAFIEQGYFIWNSAVTAPTFGQTQNTAGNGYPMTVQAQAAKAGSNGNGGNLVLQAGAKDGSGSVGNVQIPTVAIAPYLYTDLSGNILAGSALPVLAGGSAGQIIMNNATPTPTWTTVSGDATLGDTGSVTVVGLQTNAVKSQSLGSSQDGYALTWHNTSSQWEALPVSTGSTTLFGDVTGPSSANMVTTLTGSGGVVVVNAELEPTDITYSMGDSTHRFTTLYSQLGLNAGTSTSGNGANLTITAEAGEAGSHSGGNVIIQGGALTGGGNPGNILLEPGGLANLIVEYGYLNWDASVTTPQFTQTQSTSGAGTAMTMQAQAAKGSSNGNGGNLVLASGAKDGSGVDGSLILKHNATTGLTLNPTGVITIANLGTGIVHSDSSGNLTSSLIQNNDIAAAGTANIAVNKLAAGTSAQVLLNNATPSPAWTTVSGDVVISNAGVTTVNEIQGVTISGTAVDGYVLEATSSSAASWQAPVYSSFVFLVGGSGPGVYSTWASLMAAVAATSNALTFITLDGSGGALHATTGTWNIDMCTFGTRVGGSVDQLAFDAGCVVNFNTLFLVDGTSFIGNSTSIISEMNSNQDIFLNGGSSIVTNSGKTPFFHIASGVSPTITFDQLSIFGDGTDSTCNVAGGGTLNVYSFNGDAVKADAVSGSGTLILNLGAQGNTHAQTVTTVTVNYLSLVGNLKAGTAGQVLLNNATPIPTWTTLGTDATVSSAGAVNVVQLTGSSGSVTTLANLLPTDITYTLGNSTHRFTTIYGQLGLNAGTSTSGAGQNMTIQAESAKASSGAGGGNLVLAGGIHDGGAGDGVISFHVGGAQQALIEANYFIWDAAISGVTFGQTTNTSGAGTSMTMQAQAAKGSSNDAGGNLILASGAKDGSGADGSVILKHNTTAGLTLNPTGVITIANLGTGVVHADSSGNLTSSLIVNADIAAAGTANIAVNKLAAGSDGQILFTDGTTPTWTTISGDVSISDVGATTVTALQGNAVKSQSLGAAQDGYALTWHNASSQWQALPETGSGSGITSLTGDVTTTGSGAAVATVAAISGASPINITPATLEWLAATASPTITQITPTSDVATTNISIIAQSPYASASSHQNGGSLILSSGSYVGGGSPGNVVIQNGGVNTFIVESGYLVWDKAIGNPNYGQTAPSATNTPAAGQNLVFQAQTGTSAVSGSTNGGAGGNIVLTGGTGGTKQGGGTNGASGYVNVTTGLVLATATKTSSYTLTYADYHIFANFSSGANLTLPAPINGLTYEIWDISGTAETNNISLLQHASEKISGVAATRALSTNWGHWKVTSNGTDWFVG